MKLMLLPAAALCAALLSGCSNPILEEQQAAARKAARPLAVAAATVPDAKFCKGVAQHDAGLAYDPETRTRIQAQSYQQCLINYALNDNGLRMADLSGGTVSY